MSDATLLLEAIKAAREQPEVEPEALVQSILTSDQAPRAGEGATHHRLSAVELLAEAEKIAKRRGSEDKDAMLAAAICGIGHALIANGEDAEFFYAMFSGPDGRAMMVQA